MTENRDSPICKALEGRGAPDPDTQAARIPEKVAETEKNLHKFYHFTGSAKVQETFLWRFTEAPCGLVW